MNRALQLLTTCLLSLSLFTQSLTACINTTYSRADEVEITDDLLPLILGAFPHHGWAFYEHEIVRTLKVLSENPNDFHARNDLGAAYTKHQLWIMAQSEFDKNEKLHPGRYETASNLGVMYKKKGDYKQAEKYINQALEIKPGGHMGLGDYYLRMIQWLGNANQLDILEKNFLGVRYDAGPKASAKAANQDHIVTLIKNDYQFPDAYVVLGDILFTRGDHQLALRAYLRARSLIPSDLRQSFYSSVVENRIDQIRQIWTDNKTSEHVLEPDIGEIQIYEEFEAARIWLDKFQAVEMELIKQNKATPFHTVLAEMDTQDIHPPVVLEAGFYKGRAKEPYSAYNDPFSIIASIVILLTLLAVVIVSLWAAFRYFARRLA
ncbi:MAG: tetratricopeptide repeat protein [Verrucomicrobiota bacterium]